MGKKGGGGSTGSGLEGPGVSPGETPFWTLVQEFERGLIIRALVQHQGHQRRAAVTLGVPATTLHEKMKRLGIQADPDRAKS